MPLRRGSVRLTLRARAGQAVREISLLLSAVLLVGMAAAQQAPTAVEPVPAAAQVVAATPSPSPVTVPVPAREMADRAVALPAVPAPAPIPAPPAPVPAPPAPVARYLPTGTGMWLHDWRRTESGHALEVVARAQRSGLTHLYVQTGSSRKGWIGQEVLSQLLPATKGTDLKVIAWDFPKLDNPEADARRLARAAFWHRDGVPMVAAVAPDVETAAEGTKLTPERVRRYYTALRKALPQRTAILATVPWPSEKRTGSYPYAVTAPFADAFVPMAYWYNRSPSVVTATSMTWLKRFGKPVMPAGQGYDGRLDAPYLPEDPTPGKSVQAFVDAAHRGGARSISLWSWQTTGAQQWDTLVKAAAHYGAPAPAAAPPVVTVPSAGPSAAVTPDAAPGRKPHPRRTPAGSPSPDAD